MCARKSKFFKLSLKKLCWFLVFCYVFGVSLCPTTSEAIWGGGGGMANGVPRIQPCLSLPINNRGWKASYLAPSHRPPTNRS